LEKTIVDELSLSPDSFLGMYISFGQSLTDTPVEFLLGGGLTTLATACGSRVIFPGFGGQRLWPNLYTLLIAPSGFYRKSTASGHSSRFK